MVKIIKPSNYFIEFFFVVSSIIELSDRFFIERNSVFRKYYFRLRKLLEKIVYFVI